MSAETPTIRLEFRGGSYYLPSSDTPADAPPERFAETRPTRSGLSRFGVFLTPVAVAAALFAPTLPPIVRRTYSSGAGSGTEMQFLNWDVDDSLAIYSAWASRDEIAELNRLFDLSPSEGFWLEFPDA